MPMTATTLDDIAQGEASSAEAREVIAKALSEPTAARYREVYSALRAWAWKAINSRRRDDELREWFDLLRRTRASVQEADPNTAERLGVLHELVYESISVSEILPTSEVKERRYVRELLRMLASDAGGSLDRAEVSRRLGLSHAMLLRQLNMATSSGLIEAHPDGGRTVLRLTPEGRAAVVSLGYKHDNAMASTAPGIRSRDAFFEHASKLFAGCAGHAHLIDMLDPTGSSLAPPNLLVHVATVEGTASVEGSRSRADVYARFLRVSISSPAERQPKPALIRPSLDGIGPLREGEGGAGGAGRVAAQPRMTWARNHADVG